MRAAKKGDDDAFAVLVLTTDVDVGYQQLCWPNLYTMVKNRGRQLDLDLDLDLDSIHGEQWHEHRHERRHGVGISSSPASRRATSRG